MPTATKAKLVPVIPIVLAICAVCGVAVLAERLYHRPRETMLGLVRAGMRLAGMREETCNLAGVRMHYYCAGRRGTVSESDDTYDITHCVHGKPYGPNCGGLYPSAYAVGTT
jgi:hypothetical protein